MPVRLRSRSTATASDLRRGVYLTDGLFLFEIRDVRCDRTMQPTFVTGLRIVDCSDPVPIDREDETLAGKWVAWDQVLDVGLHVVVPALEQAAA